MARKPGDPKPPGKVVEPVRVVNDAEHGTTLEEVLIAFQKTLARVRQSAEQYEAKEGEFRLGRKALFSVNELELDLNVGLAVARKGDKEPDRIHVNFEADPSVRSTIRCRVVTEPVELVMGAVLRLVKLREETELLGKKRWYGVSLTGPKRESERSEADLLEGRDVTIVLLTDAGSWQTTLQTGQNKDAGTIEFSVQSREGSISLFNSDESHEWLFAREKSKEFGIFAFCRNPAATSEMMREVIG